MAKLLDQIRNQLKERRAELVAELAELDDALSRVDAPAGETNGEVRYIEVSDRGSGRDEARRIGRPPSKQTLLLEQFVGAWIKRHTDTVIMVEDVFQAAFASKL